MKIEMNLTSHPPIKFMKYLRLGVKEEEEKKRSREENLADWILDFYEYLRTKIFGTFQHLYSLISPFSSLQNSKFLWRVVEFDFYGLSLLPNKSAYDPFAILLNF